jgi:hypothetical protein
VSPHPCAAGPGQGPPGQDLPPCRPRPAQPGAAESQGPGGRAQARYMGSIGPVPASAWFPPRPVPASRPCSRLVPSPAVWLLSPSRPAWAAGGHAGSLAALRGGQKAGPGDRSERQRPGSPLVRVAGRRPPGLGASRGLSRCGRVPGGGDPVLRPALPRGWGPDPAAEGANATVACGARFRLER